jgi:hypothetical protein
MHVSVQRPHRTGEERTPVPPGGREPSSSPLGTVSDVTDSSTPPAARPPRGVTRRPLGGGETLPATEGYRGREGGFRDDRGSRGKGRGFPPSGAGTVPGRVSDRPRLIKSVIVRSGRSGPGEREELPPPPGRIPPPRGGNRNRGDGGRATGPSRPSPLPPPSSEERPGRAPTTKKAPPLATPNAHRNGRRGGGVPPPLSHRPTSSDGSSPLGETPPSSALRSASGTTVETRRIIPRPPLPPGDPNLPGRVGDGTLSLSRGGGGPVARRPPSRRGLPRPDRSPQGSRPRGGGGRERREAETDDRSHRGGPEKPPRGRERRRGTGREGGSRVVPQGTRRPLPLPLGPRARDAENQRETPHQGPPAGEGRNGGGSALPLRLVLAGGG